MNHSVMRAIAGTTFIFMAILIWVIKGLGGDKVLETFIYCWGAFSMIFGVAIMGLYAMLGSPFKR